MWHGYLSGRNTACVNYLIPAKYICFGLAQSAPSRRVFAFPVRGKRSVAWTAAIATTCSAVVPSQRSLPPGDRTYLLTVSREQPESHKTNLWCALRFWVFFPRPEERNNMEIHVHLTKVKPILHKTIKKFPNIIYQGKWDRTCTINIHPTYSYYQYFLRLWLSGSLWEQTGFSSEAGKWAQISEVISALPTLLPWGLWQVFPPLWTSVSSPLERTDTIYPFYLRDRRRNKQGDRTKQERGIWYLGKVSTRTSGNSNGAGVINIKVVWPSPWTASLAMFPHTIRLPKACEGNWQCRVPKSCSDTIVYGLLLDTNIYGVCTCTGVCMWGE